MRQGVYSSPLKSWFPACVDTRGRRVRGDAWPTSNHSLDAPAARFRFSYVAAQCVLCAQAPITHSRVTACALADTYRGFAAKYMKKRKWLFARFSKKSVITARRARVGPRRLGPRGTSEPQAKNSLFVGALSLGSLFADGPV